MSRAVLQMALDALTIADNIALFGAAYTPKSVDAGVRQIREAAAVLRKSLAQPEQEPVAVPAWVVPRLKEVAARLQNLVGVMRDDDSMTTPIKNSAVQIESAVRTLERTAPAQPAKPLTDEQIDEIFIQVIDAYEAGKIDFESHGLARAIEAAHGIPKGTT